MLDAPPQSFAGGIRIDQLGVRQYRKLIGAVMQEDQLLAGSIAENIGFFDLRPDQRRTEVCAQSKRPAKSS